MLIKWGLWTRRYARGLGAVAISGWFVWAWLRLWPPLPVRRTLFRGRSHVVPIRVHIDITVAGAPHHPPFFHWTFAWHHTVVSAPLLVAYHRWAYAHFAYSDVLSLYGAHHLYNHAVPYVTTAIEYPVLLGLFMWSMAWLPGLLGYFLATGVVLWGAALGTYHWLWHRNRQLALAFAASPLLLVYGLLNWDVLGICLMVAAVTQYDRRRYDLSAVLFAAAVFFKFFPIFYLPFIAWDLSRQGKSRVLTRMGGLFTLAAAVINGPFLVANWWNWSNFYVYNLGRPLGADLWDTIWRHAPPIFVIDAVSFGVVVVAIGAMGRRVARGVSIHQAAAVVFAVFLVVNKIYSPQYTLWMVAFGILAGWPVWSVAVLSVTGLVDFVNSFWLLKVTGEKSMVWYGLRAFPLGILARYAGLVGTLTGVLVVQRSGAQREANLPA